MLYNYEDYFDVALSINVIDVLSDDIIVSILKNVKKSLKKGGLFLVGINPDFPIDMLKKYGYIIENNRLYKDNILRGNLKDKSQWIELFNKYFSFVEYEEFSLNEREKQYPRRMFVMKKM